MSKKKVLVIGGTGIAGQFITDYLLHYHDICELFIASENKYSLCIHFKKEYEEYAKKTPAYMNQELWLFAIFYLVIIVTNICLTTTIYI